ncbi:organic solute transporter subunit alpha-like [Amphiura filiformis]|uniref:organic solute transporter subunit alpha-like n=1 Tax=Amphiura filiformis TaxID=82378 RepID=UPI003B21A9F4
MSGVENQSMVPECYMNLRPTAGELLSDLPNYPVTLAVYIIVTIATCVLLGLFFETVYFIGRKLPRSSVPNHRMNILWMVSIYPMFAVISLPGLYIPNAAPFCNILISLYYTLVLFKFFVLVCDYFGGHRAMMDRLKSEKIMFPLAAAPLLACFRCLPQKRLTRRSFRWLKVFALQVAFVRPLMMFVLAILWLDGLTPGNVENDTPFLIINLIMIVSTLTAMTVLTMLYQASREELQGYNIGPKFWLVKLGLIIDNLQSALLGLFASFRILGCKIPFPLPVRANQWQCLMLIIDACILFPLYSNITAEKMAT